MTPPPKASAGQIECQAFRQEISAEPNDATASGKSYRPVELTKAWDKSSPPLAAALIARTVIPVVTISCVGETPTFGVTHLTVKLTNATVVSVQQSGAGAQGGATFPTEKVRLDFAGIEITYSPPGVRARTVADSTGSGSK